MPTIDKLQSEKRLFSEESIPRKSLPTKNQRHSSFFILFLWLGESEKGFKAKTLDATESNLIYHN